MRRATAAALALAVVAVSCGSGTPPTREPDDGPSLRRPKKIEPKEPSPQAIDTTPGVLEVAVLDREDRPRADVIVRYEGPGGEGTIRTRSNGVGRKRVPPGMYEIKPLVGCRGRLEIFAATGGGRIGIPAGQTVRAPVKVDARRRYAPGTPVTWRPEPPWPRGEDVRFTFLLFDRCENDEASATHFRDLRYRPSENIRLVDITPQESDDEATATITIRCTAPGDASIFLEDPEVPSDRTDLLKLRPPFTPNTPWCG